MAENPSQAYQFPQHFYYHPNSHIWLDEVPETGLLRLGLDELNAASYGDLVYITLPEPGTHLERGRPLGSLEAAKMVGSLIAPISGTVRAVNPKVQEDPIHINRDCYQEGWILLIEPDDWAHESGLLVHGAEVHPWAEAEVRKYHEQDNPEWLAGD